MTKTIRIPRRFNGPTNYANGGYLCGKIAQELPWDAVFRLREMIPVEQDLTLKIEEDSARLYTGETLYVTATPGRINAVVPPANPGFEAAQLASKTYIGRQGETAYDKCYVCSLDRPEDGMNIHTGKLADLDIYASPWVTAEYMVNDEGIVALEFIYAALDCPGAYAAMGACPETLLLGTFTVDVQASLKAGEDCVIVAWCSGKEGRKRFSHTAIYNGVNQLVAQADAIWFNVG